MSFPEMYFISTSYFWILSIILAMRGGTDAIFFLDRFQWLVICLHSYVSAIGIVVKFLKAMSWAPLELILFLDQVSKAG